LIQPFIDKINNTNTMLAAKAERKFLNVLEGGCQIPVGCFTQFTENEFVIYGFISMPDGSQMIKGKLKGEKNEAEKIAEKLALSFYDEGASNILEFIRGNS
jgi:hydroxymethylbilane synthase